MTMWGGPAKGAELPWSWAEERLREAVAYWVATASPEGRPTVRPVWGVWLHERLYVSLGSPTTIRNLREGSGAASVHLGDDLEVVIVDGTARAEDDADVVGDVCEAYNAKYAWNLDPENLPGPILAVDPATVTAWTTVPVEQCTWDMTFPDAHGRWEPDAAQ